MKKKYISLIIMLLACNLKVHAVDINDLIRPANPLDNTEIVTVQKAILSKNDLQQQYSIALDRYMQSNVKSSYTDFKMLIENTTPPDYMYLKVADKMAELGFFDLSKLAMSKTKNNNLFIKSFEDIKRFYFPKTEMLEQDELYLAEMHTNIIYNDQSNEVITELMNNQSLLNKYDYANYIAALGFFTSNNIIEAEKYINIAISKNPQNINYKKLKAEIITQSKKPQDAIKLVSAIKAEPVQTYSFNKKINSLEEYILYKIQKNEFDKKYHLAYYFYYENELNKSIKTLQTAFNTQKKNNKRIYALLSRVYFDLKDYEKAKDNTVKALDLDRSNEQALIVSGDYYYNQQNYKTALQYYEKASSKDPLQKIKIAETYEKLNKQDKAYNIYKNILKNDTNCYKVYYDIALLNEQNSKNYLAKSVTLNPEFSDGWLALAKEEIDQQKWDSANQYLSYVKYIDENNFKYYYYQGLVYKNKGLQADAKRYFRKSYKLNPNFAPAKKELSL